jgi:hypothetical protein
VATDLEVAANFLSEGFCPSCGGRLKHTRSHLWGSTKTAPAVHGECSLEFLCWVLFADGRLMMTRHEVLASDDKKDLPSDVFLIGS